LFEPLFEELQRQQLLMRERVETPPMAIAG